VAARRRHGCGWLAGGRRGGRGARGGEGEVEADGWAKVNGPAEVEDRKEHDERWWVACSPYHTTDRVIGGPNTM
jgi:hypothetical protein